MAQRPHGRHTEGAVRERRINVAARNAVPTSGHPGHAAVPSADSSSYPSAATRSNAYSEGAGQSTDTRPGKHARYVPGVGDVIERTPRVGQSSVAARQQVRTIADPDETVRIPRGIAGERVIIDSEEPAAAQTVSVHRDSLFGRYLFLFSLVIMGACWYAFVALAGSAVPPMACNVSGVVRLLFLALRDAGGTLLSEANALTVPFAVALAVCAVSFAYSLRLMRRARMPWGLLVPCLAFYCLFPAWGAVSDFGGALTSAFTVLLAIAATKALADGRSVGSWAFLAATGLAVCLSSDIGVSIATAVLAIVFLWVLARCGKSRKTPEQLMRADGTTWRARTSGSDRRRIREQARARRLAPQQAVKRAFITTAVIVLLYAVLPNVLVPVTGASTLYVETDVRSLLALAPSLACYVVGGILLYRDR